MKKKVMTISHIPRGTTCVEGSTLVDRLVHLLTVYADIVIGSYFGHMHDDEIYLTINVPGDQIVGFMLVAPPVGEVGDPSVRLFSIDFESGDIRQMRQFYLNRADANLSGQANWLERYTITVPEGTSFPQYNANYYEKLKIQGKEQITDFYICTLQ